MEEPQRGLLLMLFALSLNRLNFPPHSHPGGATAFEILNAELVTADIEYNRGFVRDRPGFLPCVDD
jgi:hypothetical protein